MALCIVPLEAPLATGEGWCIGTVHRPSRGVPTIKFASRNGDEARNPELSPEPAAMDMALDPHRMHDAEQTAETTKLWTQFVQHRFKAF